MQKISDYIQKYPLTSFYMALVVILALAAIAIHGQIACRSNKLKLVKLSEDIERATFTSRCGIPPTIRLANGVVSFAGRLMSEEDHKRISAHHQSGSVKYYYRLPSDTTQGTLVNELPNCPTYREQFIY